jgi:hypothetical protein
MVAKTLASRLTGPDGTIKPVIETFMLSTPSVAYSRRKLAAAALEWGAEWILWLDADQTFPPDTLIRLLMHGKAIIGANIRRRIVDEIVPTAVRAVEGATESVFPAADGGIEEVLHIGLGVCLVHASVFQALKQPYFVETVAEDGITPIGEDVSLMHAARTAGFPAFVDHSLSMEVGHIAETILTFPR